MEGDWSPVTTLTHQTTDARISARQTHGDGKQTAQTENFK